MNECLELIKNLNRGERKSISQFLNNEKKKQKPQQGKMSPEQIKQLLESLKNEEKKTQKKLNAKKLTLSKLINKIEDFKV